MKIGLISDVHATVEPLKEALALFQQNNVDTVICAGDIAGYGDQLDETVRLLIENQCRAISGNHDVWYIDTPVPAEKIWIKDYFSTLPETLEFSAAGKRVYVVHASPPNSNKEGIKLLDEQAQVMPDRKTQWQNTLNEVNYDVLIVGHTHQVFAEKLGTLLVINPGSTKFNHACAILTLPDMTVQVLSLSKKEVIKTWSWAKWNSSREQL